jgi:conjugative relaxase-like TrwC/TraI family protein
MLSIGKLTAGRESYYLAHLAQGRDEYYLHPTEPPGRWLGQLAPTLGLAGLVHADDFQAILSARDPATGVPLGRGVDAPGRVTGFDLTFSSPKSISVLWALADPTVATVVADAHDRAVADALDALQTEAVRTRRGHAGAQVVTTDGLVAAAFGHRSSRAGDPQLHTHVVVANLTRASTDGRWSTLYGQPIYAWAKTVGYLYQAALRARLTETLGITWGPVRRGVADIAGITPTQLAVFSQRRAQITAEMDRLGFTSRDAAQTATLVTRPAKTHDTDLAELRTGWAARAAAVELSVTARTGPGRTPTRPDSLTDTLLGPDGLTAHTSSFDRRACLQALAAGYPDGAHPTHLQAAADGLLAHPDVIALAAEPRTGRRYSTRQLLEVEERLVTQAVARRSEGVGRIPAAALDAALAERPTLSAEQVAMVTRLVNSGAGIDVVIGRAGTGKTFALDAARAAWTAAGHPVIGAALAARAAAELQATAGIPSVTIDRLLADIETPGPLRGFAPRTIVVVDEAGMVGTRKLARLLDAAHHHHTKVVLTGDPRQLPEIDAGGAFAALARKLGPIQLVDNRRQTLAWERQALDHLRAGTVAHAITAYAQAGRITLAQTADAARQTLVDDWWTARQTGASAAMYALRRDEVNDLNVRARAHLRSAGALLSDDITVAGRPFAPGDEVLCLRNDRRLGIRNGTTATLAHVDAGRAVITLSDGRTVILPGDYLAAGHLTHSYATTIHKAQGATVDRAFLLGSDQLFREAGYVGMSRARHESHVYVVGAAGPEVRGVDTETVAELIRTLGICRAQALALDQLPPPPSAAGDLADLIARRDHLGAQVLKHETGTGEHRQHLDTYRRAAHAVTAQRHALGAALLADPPPWATAALGPPPATGPQRDTWRVDVTRVATYRHTYAITDTDDALGPRPDEHRQRRQWELARLAIDRHRSIELDQGLHL